MQKDFDLEVKSATAGEFSGWASTYEPDLLGDQIEPGAFNRTLANWRAKGFLPPLLWHHKTDEPCGGILELKATDRGLYLRGKLASLGRGPQAKELLAMGTLRGLSIGFRPKSEQLDPVSGVNRIHDLDLYEVSLCSVPANTGATITALDFKQLTSERVIEQRLRDVGLTRRDALALIATIKNLDPPRDSAQPSVSDVLALIAKPRTRGT